MFTLHFGTLNSAFEPDAKAEVVRILRELANTIDQREVPTGGVIRDDNGNIVGEWQWHNTD